MKRFIEGENRSQSVLFPERLDDYISEDNPVRAIDAFVEELDLGGLGFDGVHAEETGRPSYHPATLLRSMIATAQRSENPHSEMRSQRRRRFDDRFEAAP